MGSGTFSVPNLARIRPLCSFLLTLQLFSFVFLETEQTSNSIILGSFESRRQRKTEFQLLIRK